MVPRGQAVTTSSTQPEITIVRHTGKLDRTKQRVHISFCVNATTMVPNDELVSALQLSEANPSDEVSIV